MHFILVFDGEIYGITDLSRILIQILLLLVLITNYYIPPHLLLRPFVDDYMFCTSHGNVITLTNTWPASNETSLVFYLADKPYHFINEQRASPLQPEKGCVVGLQSNCNGMVSFKGVYRTFLVQFKANGFHKLSGIPAGDVVNKCIALMMYLARQRKR